MIVQSELIGKEKKDYFIGTAICFIFLFTTTVLSSFVSPLTILQIRLSIVGVALIYNIGIHLFYLKLYMDLKPREEIDRENFDIISEFRERSMPSQPKIDLCFAVMEKTKKRVIYDTVTEIDNIVLPFPKKLASRNIDFSSELTKMPKTKVAKPKRNEPKNEEVSIWFNGRVIGK